MTPVEKEAIKLYALYGTPKTVYDKLVSLFGDDAPTAGAVRNMRERMRVEIQQERKKLMGKIPILDPEERWLLLQNIIDSAMEGDTMMSRNGQTYQRLDRGTALAGLKLAHDMAQTAGSVGDDNDDYVRSIVQEAYQEMKAVNPGRADKDILNEILANLGEQTRPFVEEMYELIATSKG